MGTERRVKATVTSWPLTWKLDQARCFQRIDNTEVRGWIESSMKIYNQIYSSTLDVHTHTCTHTHTPEEMARTKTRNEELTTK